MHILYIQHMYIHRISKRATLHLEYQHHDLTIMMLILLMILMTIMMITLMLILLMISMTIMMISILVLNVAAGKAPMQSSVAEGGIPQKAVDGSTSTFFDLSTCSLTEVEKSPWWYVNLLEPYMVQLVRIDFGQSCCGE